MKVLKEIKQSTHEKVVSFEDSKTNLKAIIAIHSTVMGPSLGGCRMMQYSNEEDALFDVLRLSEGMTYKAAIAGLNLGGGKAVILADPKTDKTDTLLKSFGCFVDKLNGDYITAEDMGMKVEDMEVIKRATNHVTGLSQSLGGSGDQSVLSDTSQWHYIVYTKASNREGKIYIDGNLVFTKAVHGFDLVLEWEEYFDSGEIGRSITFGNNILTFTFHFYSIIF